MPSRLAVLGASGQIPPMTTRSADAPRLTRNERLVFAALSESGGPMKAYDLLARLKDAGVRAPMTIYRALDGLAAKGLVHKIDALNAFVICSHDSGHSVQKFLICRDCGATIEAPPTELEQEVCNLAAETGFAVTTARLEVVGLCRACKA